MIRDFKKIALLFFLILLLGGCDSAGPEQPLDEFPPDPDLPSAVVDLPPPPPGSAFEIRERNDDGSLRVEGIMSNRDRYLNESVQIRGFVQEIHGDCDPTRARQRGERCEEPSFFIVDHLDEDRRLRVVGFTNDFRRSAGVSQGSEHLFSGRYQQMGARFVSTEDGLLVLSAVGDREVEN